MEIYYRLAFSTRHSVTESKVPFVFQRGEKLMVVTANRVRESFISLSFYSKSKFVESSMVVHICNPSNQKAEIGR